LIVPYGKSDEIVRLIAKELGYNSLSGTRKRDEAKKFNFFDDFVFNPYEIKRINISSDVGVDGLERLK